MTNSEFELQFDVLYNSITSNQAPGLDLYEKSVILTKAQDEILKSYFLPQRNKSQVGFDGTGERQIDFSMIMESKSYGVQTFSGAVMDNKSNTMNISLEKDIFIPINEFADVARQGVSVRLNVIPISYLEYSKFSSKPFKRPYKNQAWRVLSNGDNTAEIIVGPGDVLTKYTMRYVRKPRAIILGDLEEGLTIDGVSTEQTCELDPIIHEEILQRGVELAKAIYMGDVTTQVSLGTASQTNIGVLTQSR